jgi:hypothetical protein
LSIHQTTEEGVDGCREGVDVVLRVGESTTVQVVFLVSTEVDALLLLLRLCW